MGNSTNNKPKRSSNDATLTAKQLRSKAFRIALEMVGVFAGPAIAALLLGGWLEQRYGWSGWVTYALLAAAFIISWVIVFFRVRSFAREFENSKEQGEKTTTGKAQASVRD